MLLLPPTPTINRPVLLNVSQMTTYKNIRLLVPLLKVVCRDRDETGYIIFCCGSGYGWLAKVYVPDFYRERPPFPKFECRIELFDPFRQATTQTLPPFRLLHD